MNYRIRENDLRIYYSSMAGATLDPYRVIESAPMQCKPLESLHYHNVPEIGICTSGCGDYYIGNKIYRFKKGDIQIIRPFVPHYAISDKNVISTIVFFTFDITRLMQLAGMLDPEKTMIMKKLEIPFDGIFSPEEYPELTFFIKRIIESSKANDDYSDISVAFNIGEFLISCNNYAKKHSLSAEKTLQKGKFHKIAPAVFNINVNLSDSSMLTEPQLAKSCGMTVSTFRRFFIAETGISPKSFVIKSRMSYAEYLLKNTDMTVMSIAEKVGYNEISGFNRIFASTFKMSPSAYRKKYK